MEYSLSFLLQPILGFLLSLILIHKSWRILSPPNKTACPPQPSGSWPILGHIPVLSRNKAPLYKTLGAMADEHGPVFTIRLGMQRVLVISSQEAMKQCFTTHDKTFASRPKSSVAKYLGYNYAATAFAPYGRYWRETRKVISSFLFSSTHGRRPRLLKDIPTLEVETSIRELYSLTKGSGGGSDGREKVVVMSEWFRYLTLNIILRIIAGKRYFGNELVDGEGKRLVKAMDDYLHIARAFVVSDIIPFPFLEYLDFGGHIESMKRIGKELDSIVEIWINEHVQKMMEYGKPESRGDENEDVIDILLSTVEEGKVTAQYTKETVMKAIVLTLIRAGSNSTSDVLTWLLSLLLNNVHVLNKAQEELDLKVGKERWVDHNDINNLVYLQAVVKETLRLYPPGPLALPHESTQDCQVLRFHVPKGTRLLVNLWKLHRDPRFWSDPEEFKPERFLTGCQEGADMSMLGQKFVLIPFGAGRRSCPGKDLALDIIQLSVARLLQGFNLSSPADRPVDMREGLAITLPKATPLEVIISPRLPQHVYR